MIKAFSENEKNELLKDELLDKKNPLGFFKY
jgi:hypothetical protein